MASFGILPNELVQSVVQRLQDRKIDSFDTVANRDLQNVRLVCKKLHAVATSELFRNMVLDFKLWESGDLGMRRLVTFATQHPDLAKMVHRLQLQIPPYIIIGDGLGSLDDFPQYNSKQKAIIQKILVHPLERWRLAQLNAFNYVKYLASISTRDTFRSLPNLYHVENLLSIQDRLTIGTLESDILSTTGADINRGNLLTLRPSFSFNQAFYLMMPHISSPIKSLRLRNIYFSVGSNLRVREQAMPAMLQHLDLELCELSPDLQRSSERLAGLWRCRLVALQQLRTLRLRWAEVRRDPIYIDDLLIDPKNSTNISFFPQLKCFSVSGCFLRLNALIAFANLHAPTLQEFELNRVTFDPSYCPESWSEIGALCKNALPNLAYLKLSKLVTHFPRRSYAPQGSAPFPGSSDPVQERWNPGLEATTAYEWRKGIHGPDQEVKGPRCPWEAKDVITTKMCKERFNSDRIWYSIRNDSDGRFFSWAIEGEARDRRDPL